MHRPIVMVVTLSIALASAGVRSHEVCTASVCRESLPLLRISTFDDRLTERRLEVAREEQRRLDHHLEEDRAERRRLAESRRNGRIIEYRITIPARNRGNVE